LLFPAKRFPSKGGLNLNISLTIEETKEMSLPLRTHKEVYLFKDASHNLAPSIYSKIQARNATPGPIYNIGDKRVKSNDRCAPSVKFGTAPARSNECPRPQDHGRPNNNNRRLNPPCPGPQTYDPEAIRKAVAYTSKQCNPPGGKFGRCPRDCNKESFIKTNGPSPASYDPEKIRIGIKVTKKSTTSVFSFGKAVLKKPKPPNTPGPQSYDPESIKNGILKTKKAMPTITFGKAPSSSPKKTKHGRSNNCDSAPGPQQYDTENIRRGSFSLSTNHRPQAVKFSTGPRTYNDIEERERASKPGPNAYKHHDGLGKQVNSRYRSSNGISFGGSR
jgi:hypothetical protein